MKIIIVTALFVVYQMDFDVWTHEFNEQDKNIVSPNHDDHICQKKPVHVNGTRLDFLYWNSHLGNYNSIPIGFCNESDITDYWINGLSLKVVTHGWLTSERNSTGVFAIKTAYVDTGGFNVISVDWSSFAKDIVYPLPAMLTKPVGKVIAEFLEHLVDLELITGSAIHVIGHSLGAHVAGVCGRSFKYGKIGRITGLDPASQGFEFLPIHLEHLNADDAEFVDVIHTSSGSFGFVQSLGDADFFPNGGFAPQPGCGLSSIIDYLICSHSKSYELYIYSVYHRFSIIAFKCSTLADFIENKCENNIRTPMGHDASPSMRGNFYVRTNVSMNENNNSIHSDVPTSKP